MSYYHLTMDERNVIYRMRFQGYGDAEIARCLGCHRGTIGRERKRNAMSDGRYEPGPAQTRANSRRRAHLRRTKTGQDRLMAYVGERLRHCWSPEQIAGHRKTWPGFRSAIRPSTAGSGAIPNGPGSFALSCGSRTNPAASPTANPHAGARFSANAPSKSVRPKPTSAPNWAIGKAIPWSVKAAADTWLPVPIGPAAT